MPRAETKHRVPGDENVQDGDKCPACPCLTVRRGTSTNLSTGRTQEVIKCRRCSWYRPLTGAELEAAREDTPEQETKKVRRARRARFNLDPEEGPLFYIRVLYGREMDSLPEAMEFLREHGLKVPDVKACAVAAWTALFLNAMNGSEKAQMYLLDRALGVPDKPYADRAQEMSREEVEAEIRGIFQSLGTSPQDVEATVARLTARGEM